VKRTERDICSFMREFGPLCMGRCRLFKFCTL